MNHRTEAALRATLLAMRILAGALPVYVILHLLVIA